MPSVTTLYMGITLIKFVRACVHIYIYIYMYNMLSRIEYLVLYVYTITHH